MSDWPSYKQPVAPPGLDVSAFGSSYGDTPSYVTIGSNIGPTPEPSYLYKREGKYSEETLSSHAEEVKKRLAVQQNEALRQQQKKFAALKEIADLERELDQARREGNIETAREKEDFLRITKEMYQKLWTGDEQYHEIEDDSVGSIEKLKAQKDALENRIQEMEEERETSKLAGSFPGSFPSGFPTMPVDPAGLQQQYHAMMMALQSGNPLFNPALMPGFGAFNSPGYDPSLMNAWAMGGFDPTGGVGYSMPGMDAVPTMGEAASVSSSGKAVGGKSKGKGKGSPSLEPNENDLPEKRVNDLEKRLDDNRKHLRQYQEEVAKDPPGKDDHTGEICTQAGLEALKEKYDKEKRQIEKDLKPLNDQVDSKGEVRTVMVRNIPNDYKRDMLTDLLNKYGYKGKYDFVYLPYDFHRKSGLGYAFVNMVSFEDAKHIKAHLSGHPNTEYANAIGETKWQKESKKEVVVNWGFPVQGRTEHIKRYKNSPVMHEDVPDQYKPALYDENGERQPFDLPDKPVSAPRKKASPDKASSGKRS